MNVAGLEIRGARFEVGGLVVGVGVGAAAAAAAAVDGWGTTTQVGLHIVVAVHVGEDRPGEEHPC